jgi:low temperature requirement protein LtrA
MRARDPDEAHRASTPLELLFDLCFVVAVALVAARLHHALAEGHPGAALPSYAMVFFAIWWAWMNFTWFASAYDNDDVPYRLTTLVQIAGVLILAAGVPRAFDSRDFGVITLGYVVMRVALIAQWLRAARTDVARRPTAIRYASGIAVCQIGWIARLTLPDSTATASFLVLVAAELAVPLWAERGAPSAWHPEHIAERYGLFTLIVLGESVLGATTAVQAALDAGAGGALLVTAVGALLIVFALWWLYFDAPARELRASPRTTFVWGYGHLVIFASAAAIGAGLQVAIDATTGVAHLSSRDAGLAVAVPVALYLLAVWLLHVGPRQESPARSAITPLAALLVLAAPATPWPLPLIALVLVVRVALTLVLRRNYALAQAQA